MYRRVTAITPSGHVEQLPSGSWRAKVYAGKDPLTGREIRFRRTCKTELPAQIELGKLLPPLETEPSLREDTFVPTTPRAFIVN